MHEVRIIGIDAATEAKRIGIAYGDMVQGICQVREALQVRDPVEEIARWIADGPSSVLIAVDAPLGWPAELGEALANHQAGLSLKIPREESGRLFRRRTDIEIKARLGKQPLDVGADRIARTAHSILCNLSEVSARCGSPSEFELAWHPQIGPGCRVIEVYPAATLVALGGTSVGYKKKGIDIGAARGLILDQLRSEISLDIADEGPLNNDDILDATVCVLAGFDFLRGMAVGPTADAKDMAVKEGWIWCRESGRVPA